ncbi:MAG TPA: hypothetical protein VGJ14_17200, partial [Sporichthyaceae bacterium]
LRHAGASGQLTVRADSASYSRAVLSTARKFGVRFSATARRDKKVRAWTPIPYWLSTPEVSGADIAETRYTCFAQTRDAIEVRVGRAPGAPDPRFAAGVVH